MEKKRNSQTTSTKCQYQAAASKPKWCFGVKSPRRAQQADEQEDRADQHVETVEAGRHEEGRAVDRILEGERRVRILVALHVGEQNAEHDRERQAVDEALAIVVQQRMVCPGRRRAGEQQDDGVVERQVPGIEDLDALRRPDAAGELGARGLDRFTGKRLASKNAQNQAAKNITSEAMNMIMP